MLHDFDPTGAPDQCTASPPFAHDQREIRKTVDPGIEQEVQHPLGKALFHEQKITQQTNEVIGGLERQQCNETLRYESC